MVAELETVTSENVKSDEGKKNSGEVGVPVFNEFSQKILMSLKRDYQRGLNKELSKHTVEGSFARQLQSVIKNYLSQCEAFARQCEELSIGNAGGTDTVDWFLAQAGIYKDSLIEYAINFNKSSCALSNFYDEHLPSGEYLSTTLTEIEVSWCDWCENIRQQVTC